jgi:hypothetical protein
MEENSMKIYSKMFGALIFLISISANANDSTARVGAGGLELLKTDNIQMVSEVLEISTSTIKVKYHFLNTSNNDIKTTVAFPMPAFDETGIIDGTKENQRPLDSFRIFVSGALVPVHKNRVFLINNIDVTDKFRKIGLSDEQIFDPKFTCTGLIEDLNAQAKCKLTLTTEQISAVKNMNTGGNWQIKETAYWDQTFPAGKEIEVVHEYKPFVGEEEYNSYNFTNSQLISEEGVEACFDDNTLKAIKNNRYKLSFDPDYPDEPITYLPVTLRQVEYILGTGRNWQGPIKSFKLILKKESPDDIVSLCFPGKQIKTSPTTIEFSQSNFVPQDKLIIFFYHIGPRF